MFDRYWRHVASGLGVATRRDKLNKSACIDLHRRFRSGEIGAHHIAALAGRLHQDMSQAFSELTDADRTRSEKNWAWRNQEYGFTRTEKGSEVEVERYVSALGNKGKPTRPWTFQMPVASGYGGRRRAIDLCHQINESRRYEFIELKWADGGNDIWGSDNPLYAAFEILGYGMAYLARRGWPVRAEATPGKVDFRILHAAEVELQVMAPAGYYRFKENGAFEAYDLQWLEQGIGWALREIAPGDLAMSFAFYALPTEAEGSARVEAAARQIVGKKYYRVFTSDQLS